MMSCETSIRNEIREKEGQMDAMQQNQRDILVLLTELSTKMNVLQTKGSAAVSDKATGTEDSLPPPPLLMVPTWSNRQRPPLLSSLSYAGNETSSSLSVQQFLLRTFLIIAK